MSLWKTLIYNLPEVSGPTQRKLGFKEKLKWTMLILVLFFVLGAVPLFGLGENALAQFEFLSLILGASFGSIISLGIGPIVTASIVMQLLNGSGLISFNLQSTDDKKKFQGIQKLLAILFIIFEAAVYVYMGGLAPNADKIGTPVYASLQLMLILQLTIGGLLILFMDEIVSKWGFGSGLSLFIAAGVSKSLFVQAFSWLPAVGGTTEISYATGAVPQLFQAFFAGDLQTAALAITALLSTFVIFAIAVYSQAMKVEIPLSFGRVRGHGIRWPLSFIYTSNIPVILISALLANLQLWARLLQNWGRPLLGTVDASGNAVSGVVAWLSIPGGRRGLLGMIITQGGLDIGFRPYIQALVYLLVLIIGSVIFSYFWVQTSGMDARSQAKQLLSSGLQIPGFRRDERILERILSRYITPLTIMGGLTIGFLAGFADLLGSLVNGTSLLLTVMIIYRLYEDIAKQHMMDMHPMLKKVMGG
ncbi:preprotein translocase subunit SecY [Candidatus Woesearchaeota archaeon]|nr:preprotein translocase subunit SecY [Candidatus Woesearchaeota archaeon]